MGRHVEEGRISLVRGTRGALHEPACLVFTWSRKAEEGKGSKKDSKTEHEQER